MTMTNISHIAIAVRDMDRALPFWTDAVGLRITLDTVEVMGMEGAEGTTRRRAVYLREQDGPNEPFIVLDQLLGGTSPGEPKGIFEIGAHHFGFWVDDIDAVAERMTAAGIPLLWGPVDSPSDRYGEPVGTFVRTTMVHDPEGNLVQFDQRVTDRTDEAASS